MGRGQAEGGSGQILKGLVGLGEGGEFDSKSDGKQSSDHLIHVFKDPSGCFMQKLEYSGAGEPETM